MKALILGYGVSGRAAEKYLQDNGYETAVYDDSVPRAGADGDDNHRDERPKGGAPSGETPHAETADGVDFCVVSPGVGYNHEVIKTMTEREIPVIAEFELPFFCAGRRMRNSVSKCRRKIRPKIVAVTGTNGKTTVVNQIHEAFVTAGKKSVLCGNVGEPLSAHADRLRSGMAVVEVSSFMLEPARYRMDYAGLFHPHIAVITNITQDHLERHGTMEEYRRCKEQIFATQGRRDWLVLNYDDPFCREIGTAIMQRRGRTKRDTGVPRVMWFSASSRVRGWYHENGTVYDNTRGAAKPIFRAADVGENTPHGILNILATACVCSHLKLKNRAVQAAVTVRPRPNRIELVKEIGGVAYYNDSKATNIAATLAACNCFSLPVTLILCGMTKGQSYGELFAKLPENVTNIIVFGDCAAVVTAAAAAAGYADITEVKDLPAAVKLAADKTAAPGVVLFSPAGSSFDMFDSYADRGQKFTEAVLK